MSTVAVSKPLEYTVLVKFDDFTGDLGQVAHDMELELVRAIAAPGAAAVSQYFVRPLAIGVQIGLRFRDLPASDTEGTASALISGATEAALRNASEDRTSWRIASTLLAGV